MNKKPKIALFYGGKVSRHLVLIRKAAEKLGVELKLISYNQVCFDSEEQKVRIRVNLGKLGKEMVWIDMDDFDVIFFRTTGKHWEEVDLVVGQVEQNEQSSRPIIIDPIVMKGKPSMACKAYQMLALKRSGIDVPRSIYGSLWYFYEYMVKASGSGNVAINFPVIVKGSGGDRGTRVFKADNLEDLEKLVRDLRKTETEEGKRYMLQEYIPNDGDFRVLILGNKVLGVMKRSSQDDSEFRNNYSAGGKVELADLPEDIKRLAIKAAEVCGLAVAGVDVAFRDNDVNKPVIWEVNKGPQFTGFMESTGIDVPMEIVKYLVSLKK